MKLSIALFTGLLCFPVTAQMGGPEEKIKEIAHEVAEEMKEIDRLLLQSGQSGLAGARAGMGETKEGIDQLLERTGKSQKSVVEKLDKLIEELEQMRGQQSQSGGGKPQQQRGDQESQRQQRSQRRENRSPDHQQQRQGQQNEQDRKDNRRDPQEEGRNAKAEQQPNDATENIENKLDANKWGSLPFYEELLKSHGGTPSVPEKYRRFHEAFQKQGSSQSEKR